MIHTSGARARLGMIWFALALGALALLALPSLAAAKDHNNDRIPDRWEKRHELSLKVNQAGRDQDHDNLRNRAEFLAGDDPRDRDSDDDGIFDGHEQAGTVSSFDAETGRLVIDLFGTDTIAGFVTEQTEIKCEDEHSVVSASSSGPGEDGEGHESGDDNSDHENGDDSGDDSGSSDNSGPGSENSGPGHGDEGDDDDRVCTTAELVPGAAVEEAELELENGQAIYEEVELSGRSA